MIPPMGRTNQKNNGEHVRKRSAIIGGVLILGFGLASIPCLAQAETVDEAIAASKRDAENGRCEQAYQRLAPIDGLASRARLLSGKCFVQTGLYPEALAELDRVGEANDLSSAQRGDVDLFRGVAFYHLERYTESAAALDRADGETGEEAQLALYQGLVALRNGENDRAAFELESAARLAPSETEPIASYYAGLAWQGIAERGKAREAYRRVIEIDGDGVWGREAEKLLESTELFPFFVRGSVGFEYDDNVILRGGITQTTATGLDQSGEKDWRGVWEVDAGMQLYSKDDWSAGVTGGYTGTAQFDLTELNVHYPTIGAYLARRLGPQTSAQARYQFGHAWLDEDPYLQSHIGELALVHTWPKAGTTLGLVDILWNDLRFDEFVVQENVPGSLPGSPCIPALGTSCGPAGLNAANERDRDGLGLGAALEHRIFLPVSNQLEEVFEQIELNGGYRFGWYDSQGDEWDYFAHTFSAGLHFEFPLEISLSTFGSYQYRDFANPSTFPDSEIINFQFALSNADREEHEFNFETEIEKDLTEYLSVSARYAYQETESNRRVYDFTRHIVGGYLNFRFD